MKALRDQTNILVHEGYNIVANTDPEKDCAWLIYAEDNTVRTYVQDDNYDVVEFDETDKPEDYEPGKYLFIDGEFVPNGQFNPEKSVKQVIEEMEQSIDNLNTKIDNKAAELNNNIQSVDSASQQRAADLEEALIDVDETYDGKVADLEEAICELGEIVEPET